MPLRDWLRLPLRLLLGLALLPAACGVAGWALLGALLLLLLLLLLLPLLLPPLLLLLLLHVPPLPLWLGWRQAGSAGSELLQ